MSPIQDILVKYSKVDVIWTRQPLKNILRESGDSINYNIVDEIIEKVQLFNYMTIWDQYLNHERNTNQI